MFALILSTALGCSWYAESVGAPLDPTDDTEVVVEVPKGASARALGPVLQDAGLIASADDFTMYVRLTKQGGCIKAGKHKLRPDMAARELIETMCGVPLADDVPFTVVEGWRIQEIDAALVEQGWIQPGEYATQAAEPATFTVDYPLPGDSLEGYLFPETYMVDPDKFTVRGFIERQLGMLGTRFYEPHAGDFDGEDARTFAEIVVMASMLEREEPTPAQRPMVAGILWKRLDSGWNLGVDATSRYTLDQWNDRKAFLKKLRDPKDPYNTRLRGGLPPTAIGNPSLDSLEAALAPTDSEFWYYLHDGDKVLRPSRNAAEHEAKRRQYGVW